MQNPAFFEIKNVFSKIVFCKIEWKCVSGNASHTRDQIQKWLHPCRTQTVISYPLQPVCVCMFEVLLVPDAWCWKFLIHLNWDWEQHEYESQATFFHSTRFRFFLQGHFYLKQKMRQPGRQLWTKRETFGIMHKIIVERDLILKQQEDTEGTKKQRQTRNTNKIMMKQEPDTATTV